ISRINAGLDLFLKCLNEEMIVDLRYFNSIELEVDSLTSQLETHRTQFVNEIDRLSWEYYYADHMNAILGVYTELDEVTNLLLVILTTSVSRPQLKSNPQGDRVMHNNSQGNKHEVEDHRRSVKLSKNKTSVTACNDSLNAKTLNAKSVSAMYDKFASESNKKPRNFTRKIYEHVSKTCSWWCPKFTPSGYIWKPKSKKENVNPNVSMPLGNASRTANILDTMTFRCSTVSNTPLSSNSFAARRNCPIHRRLWVTSSQAWLWHHRLSHLNFDTINLLSKNDIVVGLLQTMAINHESLSPANQRQANVTQADRTVTTSNELDLLFSPMFDELLNGSSKVVSKSSAVSATDDPNQQTYAENAQVADDEFINIFFTPVQDQGETSSRHVNSSNMHTFYQRYPSEHRWTKDHPLEQVIGNHLQSVRTRRQLESDAEMCIFALTMSQTEPNNIKEAMA
nr:hypothetical protein [Tanacetum cinerariifolium]